MNNECVGQKAMADLIRIRDEFDSVIDSLEFMNDNEFVDSLKKSDKEIEKREFADWDAL